MVRSGTVRRERVERASRVDVWRRTGRTAPYPRGGDRRSGRIEGAAAFLLAKVEETPDITLAELQALLKERDLSVGTGTVWRFFESHGTALKKNRARRRAGRPDVAARRLAMARKSPPISIRTPHLVAISSMQTRRLDQGQSGGRSKRGERCRASAVPHSAIAKTTPSAVRRSPGWPDRCRCCNGRADQWGPLPLPHVEQRRSHPGTG